jgi:uncharacterized Zn finger protein
MSFYGYKPYVPVSVRKEKALRQISKLQKKGLQAQPITARKGKIATTFWGKSWCEHIESFSDYANRLPRGRTYVRNGSVCHLAIEPGLVTAIVAGSSIYNVTIKFQLLDKSKWQAIQKTCAGKIGSLLDLLAGKLSDGVMDVVCNKNNGLFPTPKEINLSCSCPDWATMCKHVAAVLYGVATRLDASPEQLFNLRGVNHAELIDLSKAAVGITKDGATKKRRLANVELSEIFNIDLKHGKELGGKSKLATKEVIPLTLQKNLTGSRIRQKRQSLKLSKTAFAKLIGVSIATISNWENMGRKKVVLREASITALEQIW